MKLSTLFTVALMGFAALSFAPVTVGQDLDDSSVSDASISNLRKKKKKKKKTVTHTYKSVITIHGVSRKPNQNDIALFEAAATNSYNEVWSKINHDPSDPRHTPEVVTNVRTSKIVLTPEDGLDEVGDDEVGDDEVGDDEVGGRARKFNAHWFAMWDYSCTNCDNDNSFPPFLTGYLFGSDAVSAKTPEVANELCRELHFTTKTFTDSNHCYIQQDMESEAITIEADAILDTAALKDAMGTFTIDEVE